jgi:hypothetical protein
MSARRHVSPNDVEDFPLATRNAWLSIGCKS